MITKQRITELVEEVMTDGLFLVDVIVAPGNAIKVIIDGDTGVTIRTCVKVSRQVEGNLDREEEDFSLEVMSAGLDQPFRVERQYRKYLNKSIEVIDENDVKLEGILKEVTSEGFELETSKREKVEGKKKKQLIVRQHQFSYDQIKSAKCVISFK
ncbi:ribosome assembly cofactor RimP [Prolixibacteraceae bacterium JC049]|nr:ribosome assembly cofactor RimP [Prolixibacteraceae bacterium JC049]